MFDRRRGRRHEEDFPLAFMLDGKDYEAQVVDISWTGVLVAFPKDIPIGPDSTGKVMTFTKGFDSGPFLKVHAQVVRYFESEESKNLAARFKEDQEAVG